MSHHSVESMRDLAFRKGRNAFKNEREYREALFGAEEETCCTEEVERMLEDAKLTAEGITALDRWLGDVIDATEGIVPVQTKVWGLDDTIVLKAFENDSSRVKVLDSGNRCLEIGVDDLQDILDNLSPHESPEDVDDDIDEDEEGGLPDDFTSFLDDLLTDGSADAINRLFNWMIEYDSGNKDIGIAVTHGDTVLHLQPDVDGETPYELKFKLITKRGEEDVAGGCDFADLVDYLGQIVDDEGSPFVQICNMVENELGMANSHGDLGDAWRERIAEYLTHKPTKVEVECAIVLKSMDGEVEDAHLEFRRRPHLQDGDTTWVFDDKPSKEHPGKRCPTVLLQWLLCNHTNLL